MTNKYRAAAESQRKKTGSALVLMALLILVAVFSIGALGLDIAHNTTSRTSLQDATDAAALAGAAAIVQNSINPSSNGFSGNPATWQNPYLQYGNNSLSSAVQTAVYTTASNNQSDGHACYPPTAGVTLTSPSPASSFYAPDNYSNTGIPANNGQCMVQAQETIQNLFAGIIGHPTDPVTTQSVASAYTAVTGVQANTVFPIAVSLDTIVGHNGGMNGNNPLNSGQVVVSNPNNLQQASFVTFYMEDPCANAAWTTLNTVALGGGPFVNANNPSNLDLAAVNYLNSALLPSVLGTSFNVFNPINPGGSGPPPQFVGEPSSTGSAAYSLSSVTNNNFTPSCGIDLWGALAGAGTGLTNAMENQTLILPIVGGDQPFWNQQSPGDGSTPYQPGTRQTRPLLGFCAVKVTKAVWDGSNNCLKGFQGYLVKALVKGTPGLVDPMVDPTTNSINGAARNATDMAALANLSPGMVQLGNTNFNLSPTQVAASTSTQVFSAGNPTLNSWYEGNVPPGNNTIQEATLDIANQNITAINSAFPTIMHADMQAMCGGVGTTNAALANETMNWTDYNHNPPFVASGVGMLEYAVNGSGAYSLPTVNDPTASGPTALPYTQLLLNPLSKSISISTWYADETGLNYGNDVPNGTADPQNLPRYVVLDTGGRVVNAGAVWSNPYSTTISGSGIQPNTWPAMQLGALNTSGKDANGNANSNCANVVPMTLTFDPQDLGNGVGEYLIVFHCFDTDLGHGGMPGYYGCQGTPPGGIPGTGGSQFYGDPAFYYLDIQFPQCPPL